MTFLTTYPDTFTPGETMFCVVFFVAMFLLYIFRRNPIVGVLWRIVAMFFVVLFATLFANYAKKELKEWWNKD